jgi:hypothetical protein
MSDVLSVKEVRALCAVTGAQLIMGRMKHGVWRATIKQDGAYILDRYICDRLGAANAAWEEYVIYLDSR